MNKRAFMILIKREKHSKESGEPEPEVAYTEVGPPLPSLRPDCCID